MTFLTFAFIVFIVLMGVVFYPLIRGKIHKTTNPSDFAAEDALSKFSENELHTAALNLVWPLPSCNDSFWGGSLSKCDEAKARCDALREKFSSYEPMRMRKQIMQWISFAEQQIAENREDVTTQKKRKEMDAYNAKRKTENNRTEEVMDVLRQKYKK